MRLVPWLVFVAAAVLEVGGDAIIRLGLRGKGAWVTLGGMLLLGAYGVVVNALPWDFSRALGAYVAVFAAASVLTGRLVFKEVVPPSVWLGLALIVAGGLVIQYGAGGRP